MDTVLIVGLATACLLTGVESLLVALGRFRGILAIVFSSVGCIVITGPNRGSVFSILAAAFVGLTFSLLVEQTFTGISTREVKGLPKRVRPR